MRIFRVLLHMIIVIVIAACIMGVDNVVLEQGAADMSRQTTRLRKVISIATGFCHAETAIAAGINKLPGGLFTFS